MKRIKLNHIFSMKIPLFLLFLIIGFLPVFIQSKFMNQSFSQTQIDGRMIEVQNQCLITGDRLTRAGYLLKENHDPLIDKELDTIADIFNGRIVVVDQNFRIVKDTFGLADGRINVSEPIVKCFRGENVAFHEADKHYVVTTAQICDSEDERNVIGVLLMTVSTENIVSNVSKVAEKMSFYGLMIIGVLILCSILFVVVLMKPFGRLQETCGAELSLLKAEVPVITEIPRIRFSEAKELVSRVYKRAFSEKLDFEPEEEKLLCEYVKKTTGSDFVFVTHYPSAKRPFYAMDSRENPAETESFDLLFRGLEVTTGGQRIHNYREQVEKLESRGMHVEAFESYLMMHRCGMPPHGGLGLGLERFTARLLGFENVRNASLFPRDIHRLIP